MAGQWRRVTIDEEYETNRKERKGDKGENVEEGRSPIEGGGVSLNDGGALGNINVDIATPSVLLSRLCQAKAQSCAEPELEENQLEQHKLNQESQVGNTNSVQNMITVTASEDNPTATTPTTTAGTRLPERTAEPNDTIPESEADLIRRFNAVRGFKTRNQILTALLDPNLLTALPNANSNSSSTTRTSYISRDIDMEDLNIGSSIGNISTTDVEIDGWCAEIDAFINGIGRRTSPLRASPSPETPPPPSPQICIICTDQHPSQPPFPTPTASCTHPPSACPTCLTTHLEMTTKSSITLHALQSIRCPIFPCASILQYEDIQRLLPPTSFTIYDEKLTRLVCTQELTNWQECLAGCGSGQEHHAGENGDLNVMICVECELKTCVVCQVKMHEGVTCEEFGEGIGVEEVEEYRKRKLEEEEERLKEEEERLKEEQERLKEKLRERLKEEQEKLKEEEEKSRKKNEEEEKKRVQKRNAADNEASEEFIGQNTKACPSCSRRIEKDGGCDHMACSLCEYEFCWLCFADYNAIRKNGNTSHKRDCKYYA